MHTRTARFWKGLIAAFSDRGLPGRGLAIEKENFRSRLREERIACYDFFSPLFTPQNKNVPLSESRKWEEMTARISIVQTLVWGWISRWEEATALLLRSGGGRRRRNLSLPIRERYFSIWTVDASSRTRPSKLHPSTSIHKMRNCWLLRRRHPANIDAL